MQPERSPLGKVFNTPFLSLDGTSVEMAALLFLFLTVVVISNANRHRQWIRRGVQALSFLVFFYVVYSCLGVFGMIRNGLYGLTLVGSAYSESFYWLALPIVIIAVTLLHGPVFCGWICPTGSLQDLSGWVRKRLPRRTGGLTRVQVVGIACASLGFIALLVWLGVKKKLFVEDSSLHWGAALILLVYLVLAGALIIAVAALTAERNVKGSNPPVMECAACASGTLLIAAPGLRSLMWISASLSRFLRISSSGSWLASAAQKMSSSRRTEGSSSRISTSNPRPPSNCLNS